MKTSFMLPTLVLVALPVSFAGGQATLNPKLTAVQMKGEALVRLLVKEDFAAAVKEFDKTMTEVLPAKKLEALWKSLTDKVGKFRKQVGIRQERVGKYDIALVTCDFDKAKLDVRVVLDADKKIAGLAFVPPKSAIPYKAPAYVDRKAFKETELKVGVEGWLLPATLVLPDGPGPFPAVVLIHGSGPNDRDETIGPNKVFRDIAWGLGSRGIAVLRYEKRTREHGARMAKAFPTLADEVTDDAIAAVKLLRSNKSIDGKKVFVLGHSLGATLLPQIGVRDPAVAGLIALAGATLPVEDHVVRQLTYIYSLDGPISEESKKELDKVRKQVARLKDPNPSKESSAQELLLGAPLAYWLALREAMPAKVLSRVKQPMLVLQGERDYQVTMADYDEWKKLVAGRTNVRLKSYAKLNHLFIEGEGKSKPAEYEKAGHVAREVIDDIAQWMKAMKD